MLRSTMIALLVAALSVACGKSNTESKQAAPPPKQATPEAQPQQPAGEPTGESPGVPLPGAIEVEGALTGGQPSNDVLAAAAKAGYKTVINMRTEAEHDAAGEKATVEQLGMTYVSFPIGRPSDLSEQRAREFDKVLADAEGPVIVHCGSGNRVGALYALREHFVRGASPEDALAFGKRAGLTALARPVKKVLGIQ